MSESRRIAVSTAVFGTATAVSRVAGVVREIIAAAVFGSSTALSAFNIAYNLPNLVRAVVADNAIGGAFIPVFVELREKGEEREAWRVAGMVLWTTATLLTGLTALLMLLAPYYIPLFLAGQDNVSSDLVVTLTRILFPIVIVLGMTGVITGILNADRIFGLPAFVPVIWNLVIILSLVYAATSSPASHQVEIYAAGVLIATVIQFLIPLPLLRARRSALAFRLGFGNPHVRRVLRLMLPVSLGLGLINFNLTLDTVIAAHVQDGRGPAYLNYAFRLFMLPQGLFSVAVSTVLFPEISRRAAQHDLPGLGRMVADGTRTIIFLLLPAAAVSIVMAEPIVRLLYQHGSFHAGDTSRVAWTLAMFSVGLLGNGLSLLLTRAFFGLQQPGVPTRVAAANLVLNLVLDLLLLRFGAAGIAASTAVVTSFNAIVLAILLRRRVGSLRGSETARHAGRVVLATAYCTVAALIWIPLASILGTGVLATFLCVAAGLGAAGFCYLLSARYLAIPEMAVLGSLLPRTRR